MLSVGDILRKERQKTGLTLKQVEKQIHIREKFLHAIEENDWSQFSSKVYITGLIKNYSQFFGLDHSKMIAYFRRDYERKEDVRFKRRVESKYFKSQKKTIIIGCIMVLVICVSAYFGFQLYQYFKPPQVVVLEPVERSFKRESIILLKGKTEADALVEILGERVFQNQEGVFTFEYPLKQGKNTVRIKVTGANGQETTIEESFIVEQ